MSNQVAVSAHRRRDGAEFSARRPNAWQSAYIRTAMGVDMLCMLVGASFAANVRFLDPSYRPTIYLIVTFSLPFVWTAVLRLCDCYDPRFIGVGSDEFRKIFNASICCIAVVAVVSYAAKFDLARAYVAIALPTATLLDLGGRFLLRKRLHRKRRSGYAMHRVIAVGHADSVVNLISELGRDAYHGLTVVGVCLTGGATSSQALFAIPVLGGIGDITEAVDSLEADTVAVLACPELSGDRMRELTWDLEESGTSIYLAPAVLDIAESRTTIRPIAGLPLLHMEHPERTGSRIVVKSLFDRAAASIALVLLSPVFLAVALAIKANDGGPVFFKQVRVGRGGAPFRVWKFRTMVVDAERIKAELARLNQGNGALFKMRKDPRVTKPGTWLRRYSIDELPQLINVARGEMSLIGPRPALPEESAKYDGTHMVRRILVKPGITGLWQVSGRSDLSLEDSMRLDVHYVENWSLFLDLQILWKTCRAVRTGSGAY